MSVGDASKETPISVRFSAMLWTLCCRLLISVGFSFRLPETSRCKDLSIADYFIITCPFEILPYQYVG